MLPCRGDAGIMYLPAHADPELLMMPGGARKRCHQRERWRRRRARDDLSVGELMFIISKARGHVMLFSTGAAADYTDVMFMIAIIGV